MDQQIVLNEPVTLVLKPETMGLVLDVLAKNLPYHIGKQVIEGEIFPQLAPKKEAEGGSD